MLLNTIDEKHPVLCGLQRSANEREAYREKEEQETIQLKSEKVRKTVDWNSFTIPSERGKYVDEYLEEMRGNDREEFDRR